MTLKWYFFRWLRGTANIANGIVQTLTCGMYEPSWSFRAECKFLDVAEAVHNAALTGRAAVTLESTVISVGLND